MYCGFVMSFLLVTMGSPAELKIWSVHLAGCSSIMSAEMVVMSFTPGLGLGGVGLLPALGEKTAGVAVAFAIMGGILSTTVYVAVADLGLVFSAMSVAMA